MSILLQINNLKKSYDQEPLFDGLTLSITKNQHVGVIGRNGAGKSTLFRIIMGIEEADSGQVHIHPGTHLGYIRQQEDPFEPSETILDFLQRYSKKPEWVCAKLCGQFDLKGEQLNQQIGSFSGGYQMRVKLVAMLLQEPNLLLLDEPTNYLDLSTLLLLEQFLQHYSGSFLLISHDREFLKRTCGQTLEIEHKKAKFFPQPLEEYLEYKLQQEEFARRYNKKVAAEQRHLQAFVDRFRYKATKASQAQSKLKQLNKLQQITIDHPIKTASIQIPKVSEKKGWALSVEQLKIGYPGKAVADQVRFDISRGEHVGIVGNNGQGKSTLLKTLAGEIPKLSGSIKFAKDISVGYYAQHIAEVLDPKEQVQPYLERMAGPGVLTQTILQMAGNFLFTHDELEKPISVLSGGEKARLCLAGLLLQKHDVLLLDEPTNHLDFETVEALSFALSECNTTLLFVSHNRTFVQTIANTIIEVKNGQVKRSAHDYENYVYHLKEELHIRSEKEEVKDATAEEKKQQRITLREELKELKKQLKSVEHETMILERRRQQLLDWFEKNAPKFSRLKTIEFEQVKQQLHLAEEQWFSIQEQINKKEQTIASLK